MGGCLSVHWIGLIFDRDLAMNLADAMVDVLVHARTILFCGRWLTYGCDNSFAWLLSCDLRERDDCS
jgi:hypothetical protein